MGRVVRMQIRCKKWKLMRNVGFYYPNQPKRFRNCVIQGKNVTVDYSCKCTDQANITNNTTGYQKRANLLVDWSNPTKTKDFICPDCEDKIAIFPRLEPQVILPLVQLRHPRFTGSNTI